MRRIMKMIAGGGLSITGSHSMCGDYLYSGHTVMLTLTYLFIKECKFHLRGFSLFNFVADISGAHISICQNHLCVSDKE